MELEERVSRVERKSNGEEERGRGKWPAGYEVSNVDTGSFYSSLRLILPTMIKNIAAVNSSGTRGRHLCP